MNVWLIDYDGKIENLALMRLSAWHKAQGDAVRLKFGDAFPELFESPDRVYISCIFRWNAPGARRLANAWNGRGDLGGTGVDIQKQLPTEIENMPPDYDLYGQKRAIGFISRGCSRKCPWCVVPRKEGELHRVTTAQDIVRHYREALFLDNNFLGLPDFECDLSWLADNRIAIDFNQGLDARLITERAATLLARCKWLAGPRLALDSDHQIPVVAQALERLQRAGVPPSRVFLFILIGFQGLESDIRRLRFARHWNVNAFPMGFRDLDTGEEPARGWDLRLYRKYRRLIIRLPHADSVWQDFEREVAHSEKGEHREKRAFVLWAT